MPRLPYSLFRRARYIDPLLPLLLRPCRTLEDAQNELRWLKEFAERGARDALSVTKATRVHRLCKERSIGKPLQYILGSQPFGDLEIKCRPGVLIPRPETEAYTTFLARCLTQYPIDRSFSELRLLDLCTGTGCIPLLLHSLLAKHYKELAIQGVDISPPALDLARENLESNVTEHSLHASAACQVSFRHGDVLSRVQDGSQDWDVVISNPPYISRTSFNHDTSMSTRRFEPRLALVPDVEPVWSNDGTDLTGDIFYKKIVDHARIAKSHVVVMEVADYEQACRVLDWACSLQDPYWKRAFIWHDNLYNEEPVDLFSGAPPSTQVYESVGTGQARAVVLTKSSLPRK